MGGVGWGVRQKRKRGGRERCGVERCGVLLSFFDNGKGMCVCLWDFVAGKKKWDLFNSSRSGFFGFERRRKGGMRLVGAYACYPPHPLWWGHRCGIL